MDLIFLLRQSAPVSDCGGRLSVECVDDHPKIFLDVGLEGSRRPQLGSRRPQLGSLTSPTSSAAMSAINPLDVVR